MDTPQDQIDTAAPKADASGVALVNGYPLNRRLRAEALSAAGKTDDPDGLVTSGDIAAAGVRLKAETPSLAMPKADLAAIADRTPGASSDGTKADILGSITSAGA